MSWRERAEPVGARWQHLDGEDPMRKAYQQAANELTLPALETWLRTQPAQRLLTQPRSVLSCLVAVYLTERTSHLWAVTADDFYLFARGDGWTWVLPSWASTCQRVELTWDRPLTVAHALTLLRFLEVHPQAPDWQIEAWLRGRRAA